MKEMFILGIVIGVVTGVSAGSYENEYKIIQNCIKANADMPYNQVEGYCKEKLKSLQGKE